MTNIKYVNFNIQTQELQASCIKNNAKKSSIVKFWVQIKASKKLINFGKKNTVMKKKESNKNTE